MTDLFARDLKRKNLSLAMRPQPRFGVHTDTWNIWKFHLLIWATTLGLLIPSVSYSTANWGFEATRGNPNEETVLNDRSITTQGNRKHGVNALDWGKATLLRTEITTRGDDAHGVLFSAAPAPLSLTDVTIKTFGKRAHGLHSPEKVSLEVNDGDDPTHIPHWMQAQNGKMNLHSGKIAIYGDQAHGINVVDYLGTVQIGRPLSQGENVALSEHHPADVNIRGFGNDHIGIKVVASQDVTLNNVNIELAGHSNIGMKIDNTHVSGKNLQIRGLGANSVGIQALDGQACQDNAPCPNLKKPVQLSDGIIHMEGEASPAIELRRTRVKLQDVSLLSGKNAPFVVGNEGGVFEFKGTENKNYATITSQGPALAALAEDQPNMAVFTLTHAVVNGTNPNTSSPLLEIKRENNAAPSSDAKVILGLNDAKAMGKISGALKDRVHISLINRSMWQGNTDIGGTLLIRDQSTWKMNASSMIDALFMDDGAVQFTEPSSHTENPPQFQTLTVRNSLQGNGRFGMRTNFAKEKGDFINIQGNAEGKFLIFITDFSNDGEDLYQKAVPLVKAQDGKALFSLQNDQQFVDIGAYRFELKKHTTPEGITWQLGTPGRPPLDLEQAPTETSESPSQGKNTSTTVALETPGKPPLDPKLTPAEASDSPSQDKNTSTTVDDKMHPERFSPHPTLPLTKHSLSAAAIAAVNSASLASNGAIWNANLQTINERLQALRLISPVPGWSDSTSNTNRQSGVWARAVMGQQHINNPLGGLYTQKMYGFVIGGDRSIAVRAGRWHIGAAFSHIEAERAFENSPSRSTSIQLGLYGILRANNGVYASATASAGNFNHTLAAQAPDGGKTTGRFGNYGAGISVESGRRFESSGLWFIEPHIGMDYFRVNSADYKMSNGLAIHDHGGHLFQWRNGLRIGRTTLLSHDNMAMSYAKISWVKEFGDKSVIHANQTALRTELADSRFEFGLGTEAKLGKNHALYGEINYGKGHRIKQLKSITAGYQYRW